LCPKSSHMRKVAGADGDVAIRDANYWTTNQTVT
jgi:hypothetical protein